MRTSHRPPTRRLALRALTLAAAAGSAIALGAVASPADGAARPAGIPACRTSQLVVWLNTNANGAAGTLFYALNFTNIGSTCTLRGYPGVSAVSQNGHQLGNAARRSNVIKIKPVTLKGTSGGGPQAANTAQATVGIVDTGAIPSSSCHQVTASALRVYTPNQSGAVVVPYPFSACSRRGPSFLNVTAVKR